MQTKTVARIAAVAFIAIAITASAVQLRMSPQAMDARPDVRPDIADTDQLSSRLVQCQSLGAAGATDQACLRTWAENRRRFLMGGSVDPRRAGSVATGKDEAPKGDAPVQLAGGGSAAAGAH